MRRELKQKEKVASQELEDFEQLEKNVQESEQIVTPSKQAEFAYLNNLLKARKDQFLKGQSSPQALSSARRQTAPSKTKMMTLNLSETPAQNRRMTDAGDSAKLKE